MTIIARTDKEHRMVMFNLIDILIKLNISDEHVNLHLTAALRAFGSYYNRNYGVT